MSQLDLCIFLSTLSFCLSVYVCVCVCVCVCVTPRRRLKMNKSQKTNLKRMMKKIEFSKIEKLKNYPLKPPKTKSQRRS